MRYLVTGGAGFIGSSLCGELIKQGHDIGVIDDFSTGKSKNMPKEALHLGYHITEVLEKYTLDVDGIFHLGIPSSTPLYNDDPFLVGDVVRDAVALLEFIRKRRCKLVFASTSNLYLGNPVPWIEGMPVYPKTYYTEARYYLERLSSLYYNMFGIKSIGLRFFSVYGPNEENKGPLANVITQMLWARRKNEAFVIYGDGSQTRDSIFVTDVVDALVKAMGKDIGGVYNVGTGRNASFNKFTEIIGCRIEYRQNPLTNYVDTQLADTKLAEASLGFKAKVSLEEGIERLNYPTTN